MQSWNLRQSCVGGTLACLCGMLAALSVGCSSSNGSNGGGAGGEAGRGGEGGASGMGGNGGTGGNELGIDDPSDEFDIFDPQEDAEGMELAAGTETAFPRTTESARS